MPPSSGRTSRWHGWVHLRRSRLAAPRVTCHSNSQALARLHAPSCVIRQAQVGSERFFDGSVALLWLIASSRKLGAAGLQWQLSRKVREVRGKVTRQEASQEVRLWRQMNKEGGVWKKNAKCNFWLLNKLSNKRAFQFPSAQGHIFSLLVNVLSTKTTNIFHFKIYKPEKNNKSLHYIFFS